MARLRSIDHYFVLCQVPSHIRVHTHTAREVIHPCVAVPRTFHAIKVVALWPSYHNLLRPWIDTKIGTYSSTCPLVFVRSAPTLGWADHGGMKPLQP